MNFRRYSKFRKKIVQVSTGVRLSETQLSRTQLSRTQLSRAHLPWTVLCTRSAVWFPDVVAIWATVVTLVLGKIKMKKCGCGPVVAQGSWQLMTARFRWCRSYHPLVIRNGSIFDRFMLRHDQILHQSAILFLQTELSKNWEVNSFLESSLATSLASQGWPDLHVSSLEWLNPNFIFYIYSNKIVIDF